MHASQLFVYPRRNFAVLIFWVRDRVYYHFSAVSNLGNI
jgi:hypothetical protein